MTAPTTCPVFLHIGASKTATTTLQLNVFSRLPGVTFLGKPFSCSEEMKAQGIQKADMEVLSKTIKDITGRSNHDGAFDAQYARQLIDKLRKDSAQPIILSEEALSNNKTNSFEVIAERLYATFGPANIILAIRSQFTALPSLYLHEMKKKRLRESFDAWLSNALADTNAKHRQGASIEQYRYASVIRSFSSVFAARTSVLVYESLLSNRLEFANQLGSLIGTSGEQIAALLNVTPQNVGKSENWYRHQQHVARYSRIKGMLAPRFDMQAVPPLGWVKNLIKRRLQAKADSGPPIKVELSAQSRQQIIEYYADDNRSLAEISGVDLRTYEYPGYE